MKQKLLFLELWQAFKLHHVSYVVKYLARTFAPRRYSAKLNVQESAIRHKFGKINKITAIEQTIRHTPKR